LSKSTLTVPNYTTNSGDFNGDGKTDFLARSASRREISLSNGSGFSAGASVTYGSAKQNTRIGDFNGDGKDDVVDNLYSNDGAETRTIRLSRGTSVINQPASKTSFVNDLGGGEIVDVNGDGRADLNVSYVKSSTSAVHHFRSNGSTLEGVTLNSGSEGWISSAFDVNGDGRTDGHGWWNSTATLFQIMHGRDVASQSWSLGGASVAGAETSGLHNGSGDFNGDGLADFMLSSSASSDNWNGKIALSKGPFPDLLTRVKKPEGGTIAVSYKPSPHWNSASAPSLYNPHTKLPLIIQTVESVTIDDGLALPTSTAKTSFAYNGGKWNYIERQFLGFDRVLVTHPCNQGESACPTSEVVYRLDVAAIGEVDHVDFRDGSGDHGRRRAAGVPLDQGNIARQGNQALECHLRVKGLARRIPLIALDIDAQGGTFRSGAREAIDNAAAALKEEPYALVVGDGTVDRIAI
jgi:hypothetical protein